MDCFGICFGGDHAVLLKITQQGKGRGGGNTRFLPDAPRQYQSEEYFFEHHRPRSLSGARERQPGTALSIAFAFENDSRPLTLSWWRRRVLKTLERRISTSRRFYEMPTVSN